VIKREKGSGDEVEQTISVISANYAAFQYRFVEFLADHLADCSRSFGGDLQQMLVLAIIGQMELHARVRATASGGAPAASISASRISDVTGIPRETVRRKLRALEERKWISRHDDGSWRLCLGPDGTAPARIDLHDLNERSIARWATLLASVKPML
jgi:DNA-binding MarR family transcriptional regulator